MNPFALCNAQPQWNHLRPYLFNRPHQPWYFFIGKSNPSRKIKNKTKKIKQKDILKDRLKDNIA
jgi:hypothetical protein